MFDSLSPPRRFHFQTLVISDLHLGSPSAKADMAWRFLRQVRAKRYILAGDILDLWHPPVVQWGLAEQAIIDHLRAEHAAGADMVYLRGNHDPEPETAPDDKRLPVRSVADHVHKTKDGKRLLVTHGHLCDLAFLQSPVFTRLGAFAEQGLRWIDRHVGTALADGVVNHYNRLSNWQANPVEKLLRRARNGGFDGIICGHFHEPALMQIRGMIYANSGDWVGHMSALAEDAHGKLHLLNAPEDTSAWDMPYPLGRVNAVTD